MSGVISSGYNGVSYPKVRGLVVVKIEELK